MLAKRNFLLSFPLKELLRCEPILSHRNTSVKTTGFNNNYIHVHMYIYAYARLCVNLIRDLTRKIYNIISCLEVRELRGCWSYMIYMHTDTVN